MVTFTDLPQEVLIAISLVAAILIALIAFSSSKNSKPAEKKVASSVSGSASKTAGSPGRFTSAEVAVHNERDDCWLIIDKKVYDVTSYVEEHPGADAILNNAGADSTVGFKGPQHPARVFEQLDLYYIGELID